MPLFFWLLCLVVSVPDISTLYIAPVIPIPTSAFADKVEIKNYFDVDLIEVPDISNKLFDDYTVKNILEFII